MLLYKGKIIQSAKNLQLAAKFTRDTKRRKVALFLLCSVAVYVIIANEQVREGARYSLEAPSLQALL